MPVRLRPAVLDDAEALAALARSQREHLAPWEPERPARWFTEAGQREALEQAEHDRAADRSYAFLITDAAGSIFGRLTLASVVRGAGQFCSIGYWIDRREAGRGLTPTAVAMATDWAFRSAGLHRVEVNIRPDNVASLRVVSKLGMRDEGTRRGYLHIAGAWHDHRSFALTVEDLAGERVVDRLKRLSQAPL